MNLMSKLDESGVIISTYDYPTSSFVMMFVGVGIFVLGGLAGLILMKFANCFSMVANTLIYTGALSLILVSASYFIYSNSYKEWESEAAGVLNEHYGKGVITLESLDRIDLHGLVGRSEYPVKTSSVATDMVRNQETGEWTEQSLFLIIDGNVVQILSEENALKSKEKQ